MSLLVVNDKKLLITGFYILNSKQINQNKSDETKFGLSSETVSTYFWSSEVQDI